MHNILSGCSHFLHTMCVCVRGLKRLVPNIHRNAKKISLRGISPNFFAIMVWKGSGFYMDVILESRNFKLRPTTNPLQSHKWLFHSLIGEEPFICIPYLFRLCLKIPSMSYVHTSILEIIKAEIGEYLSYFKH